MRKIIFALFFGMGALHATQSGCGISLYYGNGILQDKDEPEAKRLWEQEVEKLKREYPELSDSVLLAKTSYNSSYLKAVGYLIKAAEIANEYISGNTLDEQVTKYKESIESGHGVVVIAHSQGNLFTNLAHDMF